jgi:hypothetical protein
MSTTKIYTPANIIQGPADIFIDVAAPPSAVPPVQGTNTWAATGTYAIDATGQPSDAGSAGFHVGASEGPAVLSVTPKFEEIRADQFAASLDAAFVSLETEIDLVVKEAVLANLQKLFSSPLGRYTNVTAGATNPAADFLQIGSPTSSAATLRTLLLVSPDRAASGKYWVLQAYKAALKSAVALEFQRSTAVTWKLKFYCIADTSRVLKDQVLQLVRIV